MAQVSLPNRKKARMTESEIRCAACTRLFSSQGALDLQSNAGFTHHTRKGAEDSVKEGCSLCEFLVQAGREKFGKDKWRADDSLVFRSQPQPENQAAQLTILQGRVEGSDEVLTIYPFAKRGDPLAKLIPRRPVHRDVQSNTVFAAAKRLIHTCLRLDNPSKGHALCRYSRDTVLPTRVLDVGDPSDPDSSTRLKINEFETHGSYLALSYCWGKRDPEANPEPLLLRTNSLHDLRRHIRPNTLQKSIQDAIFATRKLGFRYLWVDALCIIQDDDDDKDNEISQMATIYKNAAITLAAGTAERAAEGFLGNIPSRPNVYLPEDKFAIPMENGTGFGTVYLSADPYEPNHPLDKRGWTLQEFMLSSRMLIFSDYQLLWQCKEVELRSVTGDSRGMEYQQPLESIPWTVFDEEAEPRFGTSASEKLYIWKTIILQYTERELSDPNDRLRAVSGITTELEKLWRDSNFWGLWRQWFLSLLVWYKDDIDRVDERHLNRAPSWSWASLDGRIKYKDPVEVADAGIMTLTKESVVLSCRILNVDNDDEPDESDESVEEWLDLADKVCKEHGLTYFCPPESRDQCRPNLIRPRSKETGENDLLYLLLGNAKPDSRGGEGLGLGLLVMKVADGRYRRIGLAVFPDMSIWKRVKRKTVEFEREN